MNDIANGSLIITGPTGSLGRELALSIANRPAHQRPDLLLLGRPGTHLDEVTDLARRAGATAYAVPCDFSSLNEVRTAAASTRKLLTSGTVRPLHAMAANAGLMSVDTRKTSADGYELTFAVNYLAHAQLIASLQDGMAAPGRIVLVGSNTYWENRFRKLLHVPPSKWDDPLKMAQPAPADAEASLEASGYAYSNSKLAILYYAHELQRHVAKDIQVIVFEPGFMPGTGLGRETPPAVQAVARLIGRLPGVSKPAHSAPMFASVLLDAKWSHLHNGDFVVKNKLIPVQPFAQDLQREQRLWSVTDELLNSANK